jgi:hypothetical protein
MPNKFGAIRRRTWALAWVSGKSPELGDVGYQVSCEARESPGIQDTPVREASGQAHGRNHDRGNDGNFAAIVVTAVIVPLVLLGILLVEVLTGFVLSFL